MNASKQLIFGLDVLCVFILKTFQIGLKRFPNHPCQIVSPIWAIGKEEFRLY